MKVLKKGTGQKGWAQKISCSGAGNGNSGCGAKLLVEQDDIFITSRDLMGREIEYYNTFRCPECGTWTDIKEPIPFSARKLDPKRDGHTSGSELKKIGNQKMKLYLIFQCENGGYDTYDSAVVCAYDEEDARKIHPSSIHCKEVQETLESDDACWASLKDVKVGYLGEAYEGLARGVVCASFNAG